MRPNRWSLVAFFLGAMVLSAWLSPLLWSGPGRAAPGPPETALPGGINGRTMLRSGEPLDVRVAAPAGVYDIKWTLDGRTVGHALDLHLRHVRDGEHTLSLTYRDSQGRLCAASALVRVLEPDQYAMYIDAVQAAITLPLWEDDSQANLPIIRR